MYARASVIVKRRQQPSALRVISILLTTLAAAASGLVDLPLITASVLCGISIAASLVGFWLLAAYQCNSSHVAIPGASVPSEFDSFLGVHGANSTDRAARKHVQ